MFSDLLHSSALQFKLFLLSLFLFYCLVACKTCLCNFFGFSCCEKTKKYRSFGAVGRSRAQISSLYTYTYTYYVLLRRGEARGSARTILGFFPATAASSKRPPTIFVADAMREQVLLIFFLFQIRRIPCFYIFSSCKSRKTAMIVMYF